MKKHYNILKTHALELGFAAVMLVLIFTEACVLMDGHIFNGDYALYIRQAQSLLDGTQSKVFRDMTEMLSLSTYKYSSPTLYPWGFPLLLFVPSTLFGINYTAFKIVLCLCLALTYFVLMYDYRLQKKSDIGVWVLLLLGLNFNLLSTTNRIISTLPYLLFLTFALFCLHCYHPFTVSRKMAIKHGVGIGVAIFLAILMRTEGFLLLVALFFQCIMNSAQYTKGKGWKRLVRTVEAITVPCITVCVLFLLTWRIFPLGFVEHTSHFQNITLHFIIENLAFHLGTAPICCLPFLNVTGIVGIIIFWLFVLLGMVSVGHKSIAETAYLLANFALLAVWPYQEERYFIPMIPITLYFFVYGVRNISLNISMTSKMDAAKILLSLCVTAQFVVWNVNILYFDKKYANGNPNVESPSSKAMLAYLNAHTKPTDVIGCCENRTIYLYTGRISCNLFHSLDDTVQKADWYVCFRNRGNYLQHEPYELEEDTARFRKVFENGDFTIYRCFP